MTGHTRRRAPPGGAGQRWQLHADTVRLKCAGLCGWVGDRSSFTGAADGSARRPRRQSARGQPPGRSLPGKCFSATAGSDPMMMTARPAWPGGPRPGVAVCPAAAGPRARVRRQPGPRARRRYVPRWLRLSAELYSGPALLLAADVDGGTRRGGSAHPVPGPRARVRGRPPPPGRPSPPPACAAAIPATAPVQPAQPAREGPFTPHPGYGGAAPCPGLSCHAGQTLYERYAARSMRTHGAVEHRTGGYPADARQPALNPGQALARTPRSAGLRRASLRPA